MATKTQVKNFINTIAPIVIEICKSKNRKVLPSVCIAQACCESGYGTQPKMINANAVFGIKVGSSKARFGTAWKGQVYDTKTKECYDGKTFVTITDMFRAYSSIRDSIEDYYDMLGTCSRYSKCIGETDPTKCIKAIKNAGYATDPNYVTTITSIINTNNLTQYDACMTGNNKVEIPSVTTSNDTKSIHKVGEKIKVSSYYRSSTDPISSAIIKNNSGVILRVKEGTRNPYCFGDAKTKVAIGWCNDGDIRESNASSNIYEVKSGDTLTKIANKYGTTVANIVKNNKKKYPSINNNFIRVGWKLEV